MRLPITPRFQERTILEELVPEFNFFKQATVDCIHSTFDISSFVISFATSVSFALIFAAFPFADV